MALSSLYHGMSRGGAWIKMKRREFLGVLGGAAAAWPLAARAQNPTPLIGFLGGASAAPWTTFVTAFRAGLKDMGYVEGENLTIEFRWAEGRYDRLPGLAEDLVRRKVAVLVSTGGLATAQAAKAATTTIPIVFTLGSDPVQTGIVTSLNRPGGNITGIHLLTAVIDTKRLSLLRDTVPTNKLIAVLVNQTNPNARNQEKSIPEAAHGFGIKVHLLHASTRSELDEGFAKFAQMGAGALLVSADPFFNEQRNYIVALASRYAIPAMYEQRAFALAGGLMSYGTDFIDAYRQAGVYTGRILKGERPADLPVALSTKFNLVINLKTAKALGLTIPSGVLAIADDVID
jgi:putative tryptophan/tyrosine transport system substrate-binding protein